MSTLEVEHRIYQSSTTWATLAKTQPTQFTQTIWQWYQICYPKQLSRINCCERNSKKRGTLNYNSLKLQLVRFLSNYALLYVFLFLNSIFFFRSIFQDVSGVPASDASFPDDVCIEWQTDTLYKCDRRDNEGYSLSLSPPFVNFFLRDSPTFYVLRPQFFNH